MSSVASTSAMILARKSSVRRTLRLVGDASSCLFELHQLISSIAYCTNGTVVYCTILWVCRSPSKSREPPPRTEHGLVTRLHRLDHGALDRPNARGQHGFTFHGQGKREKDAEDRHLFVHYFSNASERPFATGGTYLEMGAADGVRIATPTSSRNISTGAAC